MNEAFFFSLQNDAESNMLYIVMVVFAAHFDYRVRVFPVTYPDVCDPGFKTILSNAGSTRLSFDQHAKYVTCGLFSI